MGRDNLVLYGFYFDVVSCFVVLVRLKLDIWIIFVFWIGKDVVLYVLFCIIWRF